MSKILPGEEAVLREGDPSYVVLIGAGLAFGAAISGAMQNVLMAKLCLVAVILLPIGEK